MTNEEILLQEKTRLNKLMREEMLPFITKTIEGKMTIESIDENKRKEIVAKYDALYIAFEKEVLSRPTPPTKEEILKEKYKSIDKTKIANADLDKRLKAIEEYLGV